MRSHDQIDMQLPSTGDLVKIAGLTVLCLRVLDYSEVRHSSESWCSCEILVVNHDDGSSRVDTWSFNPSWGDAVLQRHGETS